MLDLVSVSLLEYAALPIYLSNLIELMQIKTLGIIFPQASYSEFISLANLESLESRKTITCIQFITQSKASNHLKGIINT